MYRIGRRRAFLVEGDSMMPTLKNGDSVLIDTKAKIGIGDLVLANHPYKSSVKIIKRITDITRTGELKLTGDNPAESTDSRTFGRVSKANLIGKVVCLL